ncbi:dihydroorotase [Anseongella ginsenosidimutans]|uniref:Dihydroorotase n=1 Tax=Anseongella ginsenosidimutans TaxID=496056 RepID=A0A4R3KT30_9SPHI|nr:dihydroorotase [Anseongella ginsenosidimutans]QEC53403.1 dihydroorotase [Anseongella ginsenosidimutans]TCS88294.1 dihydroorotase [Anseongella ginsenosidimutans]
MNKFLIQSAIIADPASPDKGKIRDILIEDGIIVRLNEKIRAAGAEKIDAKGCFVSPGWFDMHANIGDPGLETKEDFTTGTAAAAAGGFTGIALMPNTNPPLHSKSEIDYVKSRARGLSVDVHPIGCISYRREGKDMAEMYDMHLSGAVAFSDGNRPVKDTGLMMRAQMYAKGFDGLIISYAEDSGIAGNAGVNEGVVSTMLGMKGIPALAEEVMIARDISLAAYNDTRLHFTTVSTAGAVELIRAARKKGLKITADVAAHHLLLDDSLLAGFDSNYKVKPPLRSLADIKALQEGLKDGTIDAVCSQHTPHESEFKELEFEAAAFGISALETAYAIFNMAMGKSFSVEKAIEKLAVNPRKILGLEVPVIRQKAPANITLFDPAREWVLEKRDMRSKGKNSPFIGQRLKGKVLAVFR